MIVGLAWVFIEGLLRAGRSDCWEIDLVFLGTVASG